LFPSKWWTVSTFPPDPFLTPQSSQRHLARPLTHLDILAQRGGYSFLRLRSASFTGSAPEAASVDEFSPTSRARVVAAHANHVSLAELKNKEGLATATES